jgi:hypothetical protein
MEIRKKWNKIDIDTKIAIIGIGLGIISILPIIEFFLRQISITHIYAVCGLYKMAIIQNPLLVFPFVFLAILIIIIFKKVKLTRLSIILICIGIINSLFTIIYFKSESLRLKYVDKIDYEITQGNIENAYKYSYTYNKISNGNMKYINRVLANKNFTIISIRKQINETKDTTSTLYRELILMQKAFEK